MRVSDLKRIMALTLTVTVAGFVGISLALAENQESAQLDTTPGPAYTTIDSSPNYLGNGVVTEVRVYVGRETQKLHGEKKVGDKIRAEVTRGGFANSIQ